jgi:hypothetical protein
MNNKVGVLLEAGIVYNTDYFHIYITVAIILGVKNVRESRRGNHEWISRDTSNIGHKKKAKHNTESMTTLQYFKYIVA